MNQTPTVSKTLLVIKHQKRSLPGIEVFLKNRGWAVHTTTNVKEGLMLNIKHRPSFVMISANLTKSKTELILKVFKQSHSNCIILFGETNDFIHNSLVTDTECEYKIYAPVTGPSIERTYNKYLKNITSTNSLNENIQCSTSELNVAKNSPMVRIQYDKNQNELNSRRFTSEQNLTSNITTQIDSSTDLNVSTIFDNSIVRNDLPTKMNLFASNDSLSSIASYEPGDTLLDGISNVANNLLKPHNLLADVASISERLDLGEPTLINNEFSRESNSALDIAVENEKYEVFTGSLLSQAVETTLNEATNKKIDIGGLTSEIKFTSNVACIVIESGKFSGYLVAAIGENRKIDDDFLTYIRQKLFSFLEKGGEKISEPDKNMHLNLKEVPFENWALKCAEFLKKSVHDSNQVALAFFPDKNVKVQFGDSAAADMISISIHELLENQRLKFNVYLYLNTNSKYILYTPSNSIFYSSQKERLIKDGYAKMHILKEDLENFQKYRTELFFNTKIDTFNSETNKKENLT